MPKPIQKTKKKFMPKSSVLTKTQSKVGVFTSLALVLAVALLLGSGLYSFYLFNSIFAPTPLAQTAVSTISEYFVNCSLTQDGDGSQANPWQNLQASINRINPGDTLTVLASDCRGQGRMVVSKSGTAQANINIQAQGEVLTQGFTVFNQTTWQPVNYIRIKGFKITDTGQDAASGTGISVGGANNIIEENYIYSANRQGIWLFGDGIATNNCIVQNNTIENSGKLSENDGVGILAQGSLANNNKFINNIVRNNSSVGIAIMDGSNNQIANNKVSSNARSGIFINGQVAVNNIIEKNEVFGNAMKVDDVFGIDLYQAGSGNIVRYNYVYDQHDTLNDNNISAVPGYPQKYGSGGIRFDGKSPSDVNWNGSGNRAYYNVISGGNIGLSLININGVELYNNTVANTNYYGLEMLANSTSKKNLGNIVIKNNIISIASGKNIIYQMYENGGWDGNQFAFSNNLYYFGGKAPVFISRSASTGTAATLNLSQWQAKYAETNSIIGDPKFVNNTADFSLQSGSLAINQGINLGLTIDYAGSVVPYANGLPDIGAFESNFSAPVCGDGICSVGTENCSSCAKDCICQTGQQCNNGVCSACTETTFYEDKDGDGWGNPNVSVKSCVKPVGYINNNKDCNDGTRAALKCSSCYLKYCRLR